MAHFHVKRKKGRPYLYVREMARVNGKIKTISQTYIGSPERVVELTKTGGGPDLRLKVEEFGALWAALQMDEDINIAAIIDDVVPRDNRETGPSIGEYFLYAILNRMVDPKSKRALSDWYRTTAIGILRPVDIDELDSERYWAKWDRVTQDHIEEIQRRFFRRIWDIEKPNADCLMFDTTNYYTFMDSQTDSELAKRGKNKAGRDSLRQIGLGLLVARNSRLPLYSVVYPGNMHDSKLFSSIMEKMFKAALDLQQTKQRLTLVTDKGMNSEDSFIWIDEHPRMHFITTYSTAYVEDLASLSLSHFEPVGTSMNQKLDEEDRMIAYRTKKELWGKERSVVVTHYPPTARKQEYTFQSKLESIRQELLIMRAKVRDQAPHWKDPEAIQERYQRLCDEMHMSSAYYDLSFEKHDDLLSMSFKKNVYLVEKKRLSFGRSIIVTDNTDWTTTEIIEANLDRWEVEHCFRDSNSTMSVRPIRHWTDSKIRCHLLCCVVALCYLRRLELRMLSAGIKRTSKDILEDLSNLHSVLLIGKKTNRPHRMLEHPSKTQEEALKALGYVINANGVLQPLNH
jgi:transposase